MHMYLYDMQEFSRFSWRLEQILKFYLQFDKLVIINLSELISLVGIRLI